MTKEEAIKRIKDWNLEDDDMEALSTLIPELKENENEKIRKEITELVMQPTWKTVKEFDRRKELCAWLEKQGSNLVENGYTNNKDIIKYADNYSHAIWHKLMDNFKNIKDYHIGCNDVSDIVLNAIIDAYNWLEKQGEQKHACQLNNLYGNVKFPFKARVKSSGAIITIHDGQLSMDCKEWIKYQSDAEDGYRVYKPEDLELVCEVEQKPAEDAEKKELKKINLIKAEHGKYYYCIKDHFSGGKKFSSKGDVVLALRGLPIMGLEDISEYFLPVNNVHNYAWSREDILKIDTLIHVVTNQKGSAIFEGLLPEELVNWLKSLKERVQPKPKWNEEDEVRIGQICEDLKCGLENFRSGKNVKGLHFEEIIKSNIDWLKSLKEKMKGE